MFAQSKRLTMDDFELISAYIDGEVNDEERARIESDPRLMNEVNQILSMSNKVVEDLRKTGVTIILTTHYIEEAEAIADRVGVINQGEIILVEEKKELLKKMCQKNLTIELQQRND